MPKNDNAGLTWTDCSKTAYIFYQGFSDSQEQALRYLGGSPMLSTTGEMLKIGTKTIHTMPESQLWVYPEISELDRHAWLGFVSRLRHWWLGMDIRKVDDQDNLPYNTLYPQDESGSLQHYGVIDGMASLAQETDLDSHKAKYDSLSAMHPQIENVVLYGVSRGAATTFSAMTRHQNDYQKVKLCILEAPPASIRGLFKYYFTKYLGEKLYNSTTAHLFLGHQHRTDKEAQPIAAASSFPDDIPLLIISSRKDRVVPQKNCIKLALRVAAKRIQKKQSGESVAPVYFLQLDKADHNQYSNKYDSDSMRYQNLVHAVYKKHHLPYIEDYAAQGEDELNIANLVDGPLARQVLFQSLFKANKAERAQLSKQAKTAFDEELPWIAPEAQNRAKLICQQMKIHQGLQFFDQASPANKNLKNPEMSLSIQEIKAAAEDLDHDKSSANEPFSFTA